MYEKVVENKAGKSSKPKIKKVRDTFVSWSYLDLQDALMEQGCLKV